MIKHEIKVEFSNSEILKSLIEKAYFEEGDRGKIIGKENFIKIEDETDVDYIIFKGLNNTTVKIYNEDLIDGYLQFLIDETHQEIRLYPISIYCIKEQNKYLFY